MVDPCDAHQTWPNEKALHCFDGWLFCNHLCNPCDPPLTQSLFLSLSLHWLGLILFLFMREVQKSKTPFLEFWWKSLSLQLPNYYSLFSSFWQSDVVVLLLLLLVALVSLPIMDKPHCGNLYDLHKIAKIVNFFFTKKLLPILFLLNAYKVNSFIINIICPKLYNSSI